jgi:carotenoid cleavage dioxygenase-like enzyme
MPLKTCRCCCCLLPALLQPVEVEAAVRGQLPAWLSGSLVVNGGGDYSHMNHMFDGYGLLAKVRLQGGRAWGSQRYVDSKVFRAYKREGEQQQQQQQQQQQSHWQSQQQKEQSR